MRFLLITLALIVSGHAAAQGNLVVYCAVQEEWCRPMVAAFERKTGVKVAMTRKSSGEIYAQVKAEASNPRGDIWWGGTGDPHLQAAEEGLTVEYKSAMMKDLQPWAVKQAEQSKHRTVGIYAGVLGFGYNTELLARKKLPEPKCWADLLSDKYKDDVQVADPNSSGTAYTLLATIVQLHGSQTVWPCRVMKISRPARMPTRSSSDSRPSAASSFTACGSMLIPTPSSRISDACSKTSASMPAWWSARAVVRPPMPPPAITTFMRRPLPPPRPTTGRATARTRWRPQGSRRSPSSAPGR